jgi:hypothetical protein
MASSFDRHNVVQSTSAAERNKTPIREALLPFLSSTTGTVLEVASGAGVHAAFLADAFPSLRWQPSELALDALPVINASCSHLDNVAPSLRLDASLGRLPDGIAPGSLAGVLTVNLTHITPWQATLGLLSMASQGLQPGGKLFVYGPFMMDGKHTSEGNAAFDASLRARDASWGYRDVRDVHSAGELAGLRAVDTIAMPANNFLLVLARVK